MMNETTFENHYEALLEKYENVLLAIARQDAEIDAMRRWFEKKGNLLLTREDFYILTGFKVYEEKEAHDGDTV